MSYIKTIQLPIGICLLSLVASDLYAQEDNTSGSVKEIEEVVVLGSRKPGRSAVDMPVPVDSLGSETLRQTGQTEVGRMLQSLAPSFNFSSSSISDGTDALRPATLRGLGPDQTLVLINGKRRHTSALIHVNTSVGRGTSGVDMNAVPGAAIKRIEVLRDGAAAQYGSDAIAGVINIVLSDEPEAGRIGVSYGEYSEGDGETLNIDLNKGFALGDNGFVNATLNLRDRGSTNRAGLSGQCQYLAGCDANNDGIGSADPDGIDEAADPREASFPRQNFRIGDAESEQLAVILNAAYQLDSGELYGFMTYSDRESTSAGFYRRANQTENNPTLVDGEAFAPNGFLPLINTQIDDFSANMGYSREFADDMTMDLSYTVGWNDFAFMISNSVNASYINELRYGQNLSDADIRANASRSADAGELSLGLQTINLDFTQLFGALSVAWGAELRRDDYKITAGEEYSYFDYDTDANGTSMYAADASAGIQVFPGFQPGNELDESRDVWSLYVDAEYEISEAWLASGAIRYDDYDDFGGTANFKLASSFRVTDRASIRGAISTGFRAPSMQQQYFNNISTQFVSDGMGGLVAQERGTFRNDSPVAQAIGIPQLKEEESLNLSFGVVLEPIDSLTITVDAYQIDIEDRIVLSGGLTSALGDANLTAALAAAGASSAQFFLNGADTETRGIDIVSTYMMAAGEGDLAISFAANFTETEVTDTFTGGGLSTLDPDDVFSPQDISIIEEWQPKDRINLSFNYSLEKLTAVVAFNRYGEYTVCEGSCDNSTNRQTFNAKILTDVNVSYRVKDDVTVNVGANNIFDENPDKNRIGQSRAGTIADGSGDVFVDSPGVFLYSRRSAPFGFNGAYFFAGVTYDF
ncbi:Ferrienterobactin receptor [Zhongshania aliphaticivorans]|uniref:Ferrienterobactin receptor n=1 Tax=Zhongshania aliphaticivorans TaxID=1470434 RepID=A0A5S9N8C7_9GAMM|nr:TonB-dependent receptor [Zhongshania aliphaticivorans]CAA0080677.1 Ferrienterobactin receptor [Zhongshania aliphaticivorans]CAA0085591.1 Ferrienterobactin receptor [Zhongshania aliphaticivorans]